jgi:hypothetical protein
MSYTQRASYTLRTDLAYWCIFPTVHSPFLEKTGKCWGVLRPIPLSYYLFRIGDKCSLAKKLKQENLIKSVVFKYLKTIFCSNTLELSRIHPVVYEYAKK